MKRLIVFQIKSDKSGDARFAIDPSAAFRPIDNSPAEEKSVGLVGFFDYLDPNFKMDMEVGDYLRFGFRRDTRKVPAAVLRKHVRLAVQAARAASPGRPISRDSKAHITASTHLRLLAKTEPRPEVWPVVINKKSGLLFFGCSQTGVKEEFVKFIEARMPGANLVEMTPGQMAWDEVRSGALSLDVGSAFLTRLMTSGEILTEQTREVVALAICDKVWAGSPEVKASLTALGGTDEASGKISHLAQGMKVAKGLVEFLADSEPMSATVSEAFVISGVKFPKGEKAEKASDRDGMFMEQMFLVELLVHRLHGAFMQYVKRESF